MFKVIKRLSPDIQDTYVLVFYLRISLGSFMAKTLAIVCWVLLSVLTQCNFLVDGIMLPLKLIFVRLFIPCLGI